MTSKFRAQVIESSFFNYAKISRDLFESIFHGFYPLFLDWFLRTTYQRLDCFHVELFVRDRNLDTHKERHYQVTFQFF